MGRVLKNVWGAKDLAVRGDSTVHDNLASEGAAVWGLGFRACSLGFRVKGSGYRV